MAHIVIVGGGTAGLPMAYEMAEVARAADRITVVSSRATFRPGASAAWLGQRSAARGEIEFAIAPSLQRKGIGFSAAGARRLYPSQNRLELGDGSFLGYDFLVIAAGPKPAFGEIEGLGPQGYTQSLCHADHLAGCARTWQRFVADPGAIVVGAVQGASCFAPAYESALLMDAELRRRELRERAPMTFVTPEPFLGHLGVGGMPDSRVRLEAALRSRDIAWIANASVSRVERERMHVTEHGASGTPNRQHVLPFRYAMLMPSFRGIDAVAGIDGLANERGFILVDEFQRNPKFGNVYAAGVAVAGAAASATPVPTHTHKTAYMVESMVSAVAQNIRDQIDGKAPSRTATWSPVGLADLGAAGLAFIAQEEPRPRKVDWFATGDWVHMSRCSACDAEG